MRIVNAKIVLENKIINGYLESSKGKITKIGSGKCSKPGYDAKGLYLLPAFFDSHTHGGYGLDFNMLSTKIDSKTIINYLDKVQAEGVSSVMMTTVSASNYDLNTIAKNYRIMKSLDKYNVIKG
jgi:N-acetylglucosamine-6-phosphate deacetylase